jgi:hypothetical protein
MGQQKSILLNERVAKAGTYAVTVSVAAHTSNSDVVTLEIGKITRRAVTNAKTRSATVTARVAVKGTKLQIRANANQTATTISASWKHVSATNGVTSGSAGSSSSSGSTSSTAAVTTPTVAVTPNDPTSTSGSTGSTGTTTPAPTSGPPGDQSDWHTIFNDDFQSLNTNVWSTSRDLDGSIDEGFNNFETECFDPAETTVGGGEADLSLVAKPETCGGVTQPYAGSIMTTDNKFSFTYGYIEARVWLPSVNGQIADWPAVWADGYNWPATGELDVMEGLAGQACWHFHNTAGGPGGCNNVNYTGGWHTFGADWEPGVVTWYYDGQVVGTLTSGVTSDPMMIIMDVAMDAGSPVQVPATMRVSYVKVWQHNTTD